MLPLLSWFDWFVKGEDNMFLPALLKPQQLDTHLSVRWCLLGDDVINTLQVKEVIGYISHWLGWFGLSVCCSGVSTIDNRSLIDGLHVDRSSWMCVYVCVCLMGRRGFFKRQFFPFLLFFPPTSFFRPLFFFFGAFCKIKIVGSRALIHNCLFVY